MTKVITCKCNHAFQDKEYGKKNRLHNKCKSNDKLTREVYRCTVCLIEKIEEKRNNQ